MIRATLQMERARGREQMCICVCFLCDCWGVPPCQEAIKQQM